ncbi:MAG TPA: hypothetical protein VJB90_00155 [Candidatus Nanoarchaeia archaeon]|nr:hypothetical protein [Candidatus Aenigmarchaeota archaeon]HLD18409.1 hypothetical protein [Candidatus Nanoarchaeia archaeon]
MIERFQFYLDENLAKKESPDKIESESLMEKAFQRINFIKIQDINEITSTFIFEDIYECLREAAQSLMSLEGYKPYSHEAVIAFLAEFYNFGEDEITAFNRYRILRNNCVYRAAKVSPHVCGEALEFLETFLPKIRREFDREFSGK